MNKEVWKENKDGAKQRFLMELEFVQCLCNPGYLQRKNGFFSFFVVLFADYVSQILRRQECCFNQSLSSI